MSQKDDFALMQFIEKFERRLANLERDFQVALDRIRHLEATARINAVTYEKVDAVSKR
jgi:hypothetical protein